MNHHSTLSLLKFSAAFFSPLFLSAQGALDPATPPAESMKTLDQIRAGIPVDTAPATLANPGHYFLTDNLTYGGAGAAIEITASHVTLDLNGFEVRSTAGKGILVEGATDAELVGVVVRNGHVHADNNGIDLRFTVNCVVEDLSVLSDTWTGIYLSGSFGLSTGNTIRRCVVSGADSGIEVNVFGFDGSRGRSSANTVRSCVVASTDADPFTSSAGILLESSGDMSGNRVADCLVTATEGAGIKVSSENDGHASGNVIRRCAVAGSGSEGFVLEADQGGSLEGNVVDLCTAHNVSGDAFLIETLANFSDTGASARGNRFSECVANDASSGFQISAAAGTSCIGNVITRGVASEITFDGVQVNGNGHLIEANHVTGAGGEFGAFSVGVSVSGAQNLVRRNSVGNVGTAFSADPDDTWGPAVSGSGTLANSGSEAHPSANFSL